MYKTLRLIYDIFKFLEGEPAKQTVERTIKPKVRRPSRQSYAKGEMWVAEDGHTYFNDWTRGVIRIK